MVERREYLHMKIDLPSFQFEIQTENPGQALPEMRRILEAVQIGDDAMYEEYAVQEIRSRLSSAFIDNEQVMSVVRRLLKEEDDYRIGRVEIDKTATIDLDSHTRDEHLERPLVRRAVLRLTDGIDTAAVKHGIIHVSGELKDDDKLVIVDHIHRCMPTAQLRAFQSPAQGHAVSVECVFFGEFEENEQ